MTVGQPCQFYHEGGAGERKWVVGWRFGIVREMPGKGKRFGMVRIEIPVPSYSVDAVTRKMTRLNNERVWVSLENVNAVGDTVYHGRSDAERLQERQEQKRIQQAKVEKIKTKARRFHR